MRKLLNANFSLLWKNTVLWLGMGMMLAFSAAAMLNGCRQAMAEAGSGFQYTLDQYYFNLAPLIGLACAVFTSLFLGTEHSDGTLRNKLVVGHSRGRVYLANLTACFAATLLMTAALLAGGLAGIPALGLWCMDGLSLGVYLGLLALAAAALCAIFTLIGMVCPNRATGAVVSMLLFLGLLVAGSMLYNRLTEPELVSGVVITAEGMQMTEPSPNPDYLSGAMRAVYEFLVDFLPTGQCIQIADLSVARPLRMAASSLFITLAVTAGGMFAFQKKNLK